MNVDKLSFKKKNQFLLIGSGLCLLLIWFFLISSNLEKSQKNEELKRKIKLAENAPEKIKSLEVSLEDLNGHLNYYLLDSLKDQEYILEVVSNFCQKNNVTLRELPKVTAMEEENFTVVTSMIVAEGDFHHLLKLVYEMEQHNKVGRLSSVGFKSYIDTKTKKLVLNLTIYLQNILIKDQDNEV
jgi:hypothetical protein